jgi:hypothetical protein
MSSLEFPRTVGWLLAIPIVIVFLIALVVYIRNCTWPELPPPETARDRFLAANPHLVGVTAIPRPLQPHDSVAIQAGFTAAHSADAWHAPMGYGSPAALHGRCVDCCNPLTAEEVEYYGRTCERCERDAFFRSPV